MIVVREVFQAKWGKADELVQALREDLLPLVQAAGIQARVLTDLSGPFFTVVAEGVFDSLAAWEQFQTQIEREPGNQAGHARSAGLIESGRREIFTVEA